MTPAHERAHAPNSPARGRSGASLPAAAAVPAPRSPLARVLALQRTIGNSATKRLLARSPRKPYQHQWENPALLETIYPARELMLKKFVSIYREIELRELTDPAARQRVIDETRKAMQAEIDRLKGLKEQSTKDKARIGQLEATLKQGQASTTKAFEDAVRWEREHRADPLAGAALMTEVKRLFGTKAVPDWLEPMVLNYAGMRYKTAHDSYYSPVRLLYMLERARGTWKKALADETAAAEKAYKEEQVKWEAKDPNPTKRGKKPPKPKPITQSVAERSAIGLSADDAVARLEKMHDAGEIPDWAWHKIVRLTELRTWYAEKGWEDVAQEKPPAGADPVWVKVMGEWTNPRGESLGKLGYGGGTGWREETKRRNVLVTTRMVCEQLSEVAQLQRGVTLEGGLSKNAQTFIDAAAAGARPGAKKNIAGAYFREPKALADLRPGAALFWVEETKWEVKEPDDSIKVRAIAGARYPMPTPPEYVKEWTDWSKTDEGKKWLAENEAYKRAKRKWDLDKKAWDVKAAKVKTAVEKAKTPEQQDTERAKLPAAPVEPTPPKDTQPEYKEQKLLPVAGKGLLLPRDGQVVNDWTYTVTPGSPITRSKGGITHWLGWKHQATVLRVMPDGRIITFETVTGGSGFGERSLHELTQPGVFVGYMPGEVDTPLAPADDIDLGEIFIDLVLPSLAD